MTDEPSDVSNEPLRWIGARQQPAEAYPLEEPELDAVADVPPDTIAPTGTRIPPKLRSLDVLVLLIILLGASVTRFARLDAASPVLDPSNPTCTKSIPLGPKCYDPIVLDEVHYIPDSRDVLLYGTESDARVPAADGPYVVHPPIGKWYMAAGIKIFGDNPFGWRFFAAFLGTLSVLIIYLLALRLWRSPWWAALAAVFLATDGLWFVQSRIAMLDIYAAVFLLAAVWLLVIDRDEIPPDHRGFRWYRVFAGALLGLALASKWNVATLAAVAVVTAAIWDVRKIFRDPHRRFVTRMAGFTGALVLLPAIVYVASYTPWFVDTHRYSPPLCQSSRGVVSKWGCYQWQMASFHRDLAKFEVKTSTPSPSATPATTTTRTEPAHPYFGEAYSWPWIGRPVVHSYTSLGQGPTQRDAEIIGIPNPATWWPAFTIGFLAMAWLAIRKDGLAAFLLAMFLAGWLPYLVADTTDRPVFLFYATPMIPFMSLMLVHLWQRQTARWPQARSGAIVHAALAVIVFAYFYPVLAAVVIPHNGRFGWFAHMWLRHDCTVTGRIKLLCWI